MTKVNRFNRNYRGFTLLEVLTAMLILSIGIMGALKMQLYSLQTAQDAKFSLAATRLALELADEMRSNHEQSRRINTNPFVKINFQANKDIVDTSGTCFNDNCNPEQLAQADIAEWLTKLSTALPNARAAVCSDDTPWNATTGTFTWDCSAAGPQPSTIIKVGWKTNDDTRQNSPPRIAIAVTANPD